MFWVVRLTQPDRADRAREHEYRVIREVSVLLEDTIA